MPHSTQFGAKLSRDNINTKCWGMAFEFCYLSLNKKGKCAWNKSGSYISCVFYYREFKRRLKKKSPAPLFFFHFYHSSSGGHFSNLDFYPSCLLYWTLTRRSSHINFWHGMCWQSCLENSIQIQWSCHGDSS